MFSFQFRLKIVVVVVPLQIPEFLEEMSDAPGVAQYTQYPDGSEGRSQCLRRVCEEPGTITMCCGTRLTPLAELHYWTSFSKATEAFQGGLIFP